MEGGNGMGKGDGRGTSPLSEILNTQLVIIELLLYLQLI